MTGAVSLMLGYSVLPYVGHPVMTDGFLVPLYMDSEYSAALRSRFKGWKGIVSPCSTIVGRASDQSSSLVGNVCNHLQTIAMAYGATDGDDRAFSHEYGRSS